jgi:hypothetical protein
MDSTHYARFGVGKAPDVVAALFHIAFPAEPLSLVLSPIG